MIDAMKPEAAIYGIGTAVPPYRIEQMDAAGRLADALAEEPDNARWARRLFKQCAVETRYTCEPSLMEPAGRCRYLPGTPLDEVPFTSERMKAYERSSIPLALEAASKALDDSRTEPSSVTHVITVSCTGQFLPGLDSVLVRRLGLAPETHRLPLQFLGCAAGLKAIGEAKRIAEADPSALILIVCVELCTLHIQPSSKREDLFAAAFFGDGASACVIGTACKKTEQSGLFTLGSYRTVLLPDSAEEMTWRVGDYGFDLFLSPRIPELLERHVPEQVALLFSGIDARLPELWAIHPGGRGIIDSLQQLFQLSAEQTRASRTVLRDYGNISSATILFVLHELRSKLDSAGKKGENGIALAFGPGMTAELLRFIYKPEKERVAEANLNVEDVYV